MFEPEAIHQDPDSLGEHVTDARRGGLPRRFHPKLKVGEHRLVGKRREDQLLPEARPWLQGTMHVHKCARVCACVCACVCMCVCVRVCVRTGVIMVLLGVRDSKTFEASQQHRYTILRAHIPRVDDIEKSDGHRIRQIVEISLCHDVFQ